MDHATEVDDTLSREEVIRLLDEQSNAFLGFGADAFLALARKGDLPDHPLVAHLVLLAGEGSC